MDLSYLLHATEDAEKVATAVRGLVGDGTSFETEDMVGHFGNSIKKVSVHLHGEEATRVFTLLTERMPRAFRESAAKDIDNLIDEHSSLYLRFDKQRLVQGEIAAGYDEAIRLKAKPRAYLMHGHARDLFLGQLKAK